MSALHWSLAVLAALLLLVAVAGRLGWLRGRVPADLGLRDGRLKRPSRTPNSVTSQAALWADHPQRDYAHIEPLPGAGGAPPSIARLRAVVEHMPGATIVEQRDDYLYAQFETRALRFVDDVEFWYDPVAQVVQVRSASRVGRRDFGVNRARVEAIRRQLLH
jgi:uncharacterized protein (DUF1499 family)